MTNVKEFHCHMRLNLQPYEGNQIGLAPFHGTGENVQLGLSEYWARLSIKWTLQTILILFKQQKPGKVKDCCKCFVLRTCNFGFRSHLFLYQKLFCCQFNLKKILFFHFFATFAFSKVIHKAKVSSRTGGP